MNFDDFIKLSNLFAEHKFHLYLVGGGVRDYLLDNQIKDYDLVSDAMPHQMEEFLENVDDSFSKYGSITLSYRGSKVDITTLRKERYLNRSRIPSEIEFTTSLQEDSLRRDFTINALYMDKDKKIYDFHHGLDDLHSHVIKCIGDYKTKMQEDPLRILRAIRFKEDLHFDYSKPLENFIVNHLDLINQVSLTMVKKEIAKMSNPNGVVNKYHLDEILFLKDYPKLQNAIIFLDKKNLTKQELESIRLLGVSYIVGQVDENLLRIYNSFIDVASNYQEVINNRSKGKMNLISLEILNSKDYQIISELEVVNKLNNLDFSNNLLIDYRLYDRISDTKIKNRADNNLKRLIKNL